MKHAGKNFTGDGYLVFRCSHTLAAELIKREHYSKSCAKISVYAFVLISPCLEVVGAALWMPPTKPAAASVFSEHAKVLCLSRFVVISGLGRNAASWSLSRCISFIKTDGRFKYLLTFADTYMNHTGGIYKATNWNYLGQTKPTAIWMSPEGALVTKKRGPVNLTTRQMLALGCRLIGAFPKYRYGLAL